MIIPIVMASDENYLLPTCTTIMSVLENGSGENKYKVYLLVNKKFLDMDRGVFAKIKERYSNFDYEYLTVNEALFADAATTNYHITVETYYRLVISDLLPEYEKCMYLDGDLLLQCDVAEIFQANMGNNYLAAVKDIGMQCGQGSYYTQHQEELGFDSMESYFNAGVLVFNLAQIRADNMVPVFLKAIEKKYTIEDQDILNVTCRGRITYLPVKYNAFSGFLDKPEFYNCGGYREEELKEIEEDRISVIHFAGGQDKPWKNLHGRKAMEWWKMVETIPEADWVNRKKEEIYRDNIAVDFDKIVEICGEYPHVIIYGYTYISRELFDRLTAGGVRNIRFFCDKNEKKIGEVYCGKRVIEFPEWLPLVADRYLIIISSQKAFGEIREELAGKGVPENQMVRYIKKDCDYYLSVERDLKNAELKEIFEILKLQDAEKYGKMTFSDFAGGCRNISACLKQEELCNRFYVDKWYSEPVLVSIIIPAYNAEGWIDRCLLSVIQQTYCKWECIVIDDGSTDSTAEILDKWGRKDRRFQIYHQENKGMGPTRNRGILLAKGEYITFIDADDWVDADYVESMILKMLREDADICKSNFTFHDISAGTVFEAKITDEIDVHNHLTYVAPNMWCNMYKKDLFINNKIQMPGIPLEDMAVYPLLLLKAGKVTGLQKPIYHYQINTGSSVMDNMKNIEYYPQAVDYMVKEAKRLDLWHDFKNLLRDICYYHIIGAVESRVKNNYLEEQYLQIKREWFAHLEQVFPGSLYYQGITKIWIWGSYNLSRIVSFIPNINGYKLGGRDLAYYYGFSSIIPLMQNKTTEFEIDIKVENPVRADQLGKERNQSFKRIETLKWDFLLIDLLEERYNLLEISKGNWISASSIPEECQFNGEISTLKRSSARCRKLWEKSCDKFIELILGKFEASNIILVENYLSPKCRNKAGRMLSWDDIEQTNLMLKEYYDYFKAKLGSCKTLQIKSELNFTSGASDYGIEPAYYNVDAHREMAQRLWELMTK